MSRSALLTRATETALTAGTVTGRTVLRAVVYARVSSDPNNRGKSVADQIAECKRECEHRGWQLVEVFEDNDRSASRYATKERKNYARLVEFLRAGKADVLMTWESSRAQRDLEVSIPWFRRDLSYAALHVWSLFLRASVMVRSNSTGGRPPAALCLRRGL